MKNRVLLLWDNLQTSIWPIPVVFCLSGLLLAMLALSIERDYWSWASEINPLPMPVAAAREILSLITASVLSVGGVVFSMSMVALTLTSGQYGPKILRQFLSDNNSKVSLGMFIGTSLYCLAVLASYGDYDKPGLTVLIALLLTLAALASFINFIHSIATDLQADKIVERIGSNLRQSLEVFARADNLPARSEDVASWRRKARGLTQTSITAASKGYILAIDYAEIVNWCEEHSYTGMLRVRAGDFLLPGTCIMTLYGSGEPLAAEDEEQLRVFVQTGPLRTPLQDPEYPITQLNQLAARALSPGINDPGTAVTCIDWFSMATARIIDCDLPGKVLLNTKKEPVLLVRFTDFAGILKVFYAPARQFAASNIPVLISLLSSLIRLSELTDRPDRLRELVTIGQQLSDTIENCGHAEYDLRGFRQRYGKLKALCARLDSDNGIDHR